MISIFDKYLIFGEGARQQAVAQILARDGKAVFVWPDAPAEHEKDGKTMAVLPMPPFGADGKCCGLNEDELLGEIARHASVSAGGRIPPSFTEKAAQRGIKLHDYSLREDFAVANALITAEAAAQLAMSETDITVFTSRCLVIGYGRIGRVLSRLLQAMGALVTVSARRSADFAWIRVNGLDCADTRSLEGLGRFDLIFNTVPAPVISLPELLQVREDALIIDLASLPGGVDMSCARQLGRRAVHALALPGKYAVRSAACCVCDSLYAIGSEEDNGY